MPTTRTERGERGAGPSLDQRLSLRDRPVDQFRVMHQTWRSLLFLHWTVDATAIQRALPAGLRVDTWEGEAYLGLVPFFMRRIRPRFLPPVPGISDFLETNVRTYVVDENGSPGVWFFSLEANRWLAVAVARRFFRLPYFHATMHASQEDLDRPIEYETARRGTRQRSRFVYRGTGPTRLAVPGTLEFFLVERYLLYADLGGGRLACGRVHHAPYRIREAVVDAWDDELLRLSGFDTGGRRPDHELCAPGVTVDVYPIRPLD